MVQSLITRKPRISLYVEEQVKADLERLAKIRKRSVNSLIELLCEEEVKAAKERGEIND